MVIFRTSTATNSSQILINLCYSLILSQKTKATQAKQTNLDLCRSRKYPCPGHAGMKFYLGTGFSPKEKCLIKQSVVASCDHISRVNQTFPSLSPLFSLDNFKMRDSRHTSFLPLLIGLHPFSENFRFQRLMKTD